MLSVNKCKLRLSLKNIFQFAEQTDVKKLFALRIVMLFTLPVAMSFLSIFFRRPFLHHHKHDLYNGGSTLRS